MRRDTTNATTRATIAVMCAIAIAVLGLTGCGLLDAIRGGAPECDGENGANGCVCPETDDVCRGEGCVCESGFAVCNELSVSCTVIGDDGCFNAACSCSGADCDCSEVGTCLSSAGSFEVFGDDAFVTCEGDCRCNLEECTCGPLGCAIGPVCGGDNDCALLELAEDIGCATDDECADGEFCGSLAGGRTTACFIEAVDGCAEALPVDNVERGGSTDVCATGTGASCVDNVCEL
jgi:hypothetical protein